MKEFIEDSYHNGYSFTYAFDEKTFKAHYIISRVSDSRVVSKGVVDLVEGQRLDLVDMNVTNAIKDEIEYQELRPVPWGLLPEDSGDENVRRTGIMMALEPIMPDIKMLIASHEQEMRLEPGAGHELDRLMEYRDHFIHENWPSIVSAAYILEGFYARNLQASSKEVMAESTQGHDHSQCVPNAETIETMLQAESGEGLTKPVSVDDMLDSLGIGATVDVPAGIPIVNRIPGHDDCGKIVGYTQAPLTMPVNGFAMPTESKAEDPMTTLMLALRPHMPVITTLLSLYEQEGRHEPGHMRGLVTGDMNRTWQENKAAIMSAFTMIQGAYAGNLQRTVEEVGMAEKLFKISALVASKERYINDALEYKQARFGNRPTKILYSHLLTFGLKAKKILKGE